MRGPAAKAPEHPVMVSIGPNARMGAWDLQLLVGNFASEADARKYADRVVEFLAREAGGKFTPVGSA